MSKIFLTVILMLLVINIVIAPISATRTIEVTKAVNVKKSLLAKQLTDLKSYKEIFPAFVKSVEVDPTTNHAKFIIEAQGRNEADVQSTVQKDGTFVVEILSGELKGSKIITKLKDRVGFDGTPKGATTVKTTLILETGIASSIALTFISDDQIGQAVGDGFYDLGQYVKSKSSDTINVDSKKTNSKPKLLPTHKDTPKTEAARVLDPQKEAMRAPSSISEAMNNFATTLKSFFGIH